MSKLFSPITIKNITLKNRIVMSPMCMYSSSDQSGHITPFHMTHYVSRAIGQVGLIMIEATAVTPEGRISPHDLGIWSDEHVQGFQQLNKQIHAYGAKSAIQIAHAGRKAQLDTVPVSPSPLAFDDSYKKPHEMSQTDIEKTVKAFRLGARRAKEANFDIIEIHGAHGYLINQFLSPLTNKRTDEYGGSQENRYRFLRQIIDEIKQEWSGPLFIRISTNEYHDEGNSLDNILYFTRQMKEQGIDLIDSSSGGVVPAHIHTYPGYQVSRCEIIRNHTDILTGAVGLITTGIQAEEILANNRADLILIGRALLRNPYWAKLAANELNYDLTAPRQYERGWKL